MHRGLLAFIVFIGGITVQACDAGPGPPANRLSGETSLYLRAHARNPVDWHPWGAEAIERARGERKPIFLSVGYATCYWCHVMEREVFSDPGIAAVMNAHFVNIKVDREERPDVDEIYMTATQLITGGGGWPNSVFLTPDLEPFFAGTYFPPEDLPGRPGFPRVLNLMREAWENRRDDLVEQAGRVADAVRSFQRDQVAADGTTEPDDAILSGARSHLKTRYDAVNGGFGPAPKFPAPLRIELALNEYERTGDESLLSMATHTMDVMMRGGLYDHVGGGFHRYATDSAWRIPHFEKMLYNQADLARVYLLAFDITGDTAYRAVAEDVLSFVHREMRSADGAFHASVDSETDAVEGRYYLWSESEIRETLGADADGFLGWYGLAPMPGAELDVGDTAGAGVLYVRGDAGSTGPPAGLEAMRESLRSARAKRKRPVVDPKVITAWNAQMIDAFAYAGLVTGEGRHIETAARAADFLLDRLWDDELGLYRIYSDGAARRRAFQEDYACLIGGLLSLYEASADTRWLVAAETLTNRMNERFRDPGTGGYYFGEVEEYQLLRTRNAFDGARASGNGVAARVLLSLARHTGETRYRTQAARLFGAYAASMTEVPGRFTSMILALRTYLHGEEETLRTGIGVDRAIAAAGGSDAAVGGSDAAAGGSDAAASGPDAGSGGANAAVEVVGTGLRGNGRVEGYLNVVPGPRDGVFDATVSIRIEDGWHIVGGGTDVPGLVPTAVTFNADSPVRTAEVSYPPADTLRFGFSDVPLEVYQGEIRLGARVELDPGSLAEGGRLYATLYFQACNDTVCLAPEEKALSASLDP